MEDWGEEDRVKIHRKLVEKMGREKSAAGKQEMERIRSEEEIREVEEKGRNRQ